jgi:hypothetical protein
VSQDWQTAYMAVSVALGDSVDDALASLAEPLSAECVAIAGELRSPSRAARVRALARAVTEVARAVDALELA